MTRSSLPSRLRPLGLPALEPTEIRQLRADLARKTRLVEDTLLSLDNLVSPLDWQDAGFGGSGSWRWARPVDRTMDRTHAPLNYLNEQEWRWALAQARDLIQRNHLALGFRDHVSNFIGPVDIAFVLRGQSPGATAIGPEDADGTEAASVHPLVRACTQVWDEWREWAEWGQGAHDREAECRRRLIVEGECTLRFFEGDGRSGGLPHVRHIEPELIRTPPGHSTLDRYGWGVITADADDEDELGLWVCHYQNVSEGKEVPASEYVRIKGNVDRTVKRGWSDFNPVGEQLRKMMGLLDNMAHVARLQAAIAWWEEYPTATMQQVSNMILAGQDYSRTKLPPNALGSDQSVTNYEAGTVVRTENGREVKPGPVSAPEGFGKVEQMVLRGIGFRWGCPSYFSGDSQDSFASVLVTGSPFVRITEARQEEVKGFARKVACRVLEFAERTGRLPRGASGRVRPVATAKPVVIADEEKQARTFLSLYEKNCADPVEFIRKRGGDPKVVAANIAAWQKKFAPPPQPGGAPGGGLPPSGPTPAPPGSAGGDGSSPNEPVGGDVRPTAECFTGSDNDGALWIDGARWGQCVTEPIYKRLSEAGKDGLVKKVITNKDGKRQTVYVRPLGSDAPPTPKAGAKDQPSISAPAAAGSDVTSRSRHGDAARDRGTTDYPKPKRPSGGAPAQTAKLGDEERPVSTAPVYVPSHLERDTDAHLERAFGKGSPAANRAALSASLGMPDDARLEVVHAGPYKILFGDDTPIPGAHGVRVEVSHPKLDRVSRFIGVDNKGRTFIRNEVLEVRPGNRGLGGDIFANQVAAASASGVKYINTHAAGHLNSSMNGYYTWPRFGYDQKISNVSPPGKNFDRLRQLMPQAKSILDVMDTPKVEGLTPEEFLYTKKQLDRLDAKLGKPPRGRGHITGAEWWQVHGSDLHNMNFDLNPKSRSMQALVSYRAGTKRSS